ncbi:MAG: diacylglycerol kinase family lipid kinase [Elusimicrobiaceae bacterium]|nr:diacylglycerol kinase family lipid kinase [Elusimicrobiaceae bacterium]
MIRFIVNPSAGKHKNLKILEKDIKKLFPESETIYTKYAGNAKELALEAAQKNYSVTVAVGGDGTINEVTQGLVNSNTALGIIPCGSGNGFARMIKIPLKDTLKCLEIIKKGRARRIDVGQANNEYFLNVAGFGFDALVAQKFAKSKRRGKLPYFKIGIKEYFSYQPVKCNLIFEDGIKTELSPLCLAFANGNQYGSNFYIAPKASLDDGLLDMINLAPANIFKILFGLPNFFKEGLSPIKLTNTKKIKEVTISVNGPFVYHIDGEPRECQNGKLKVKICPKSLIVIVPEE